MLSVVGKPTRLCSGFTRRELLTIGALGFGGLALPELLRAEQASGIRNSRKAVIMIYMCGAPPHQDMYDLKMSAPVEVRGEFSPIATNVAGIQICEHLPRLAKIMDKLVPLRSVYGSPDGDHDSYICYTGRSKRKAVPGEWPSLGATLNKLQGARSPEVPGFIGLSPKTGHPPYGSPGHPGFLGVAHSAFRPHGEAMENMQLQGITADRLMDRKQLLSSFDTMQRRLDASGTMSGMDVFQQQAVNLLTSSRLREALDLSQEDAATRQRYGQGDPKNYGDGAPRNLEHFLLARRLVEAGARCVTLNFGRWDFHAHNFSEFKNTHGPLFDQGLSALVEDLHARGLDKDVAVVAWGEFGRTPQINKDGGRDHWPQVGGGLLAGGGWRTGQVIGATDRLGGEITERPVHFGEVFASLYQHMGINPLTTTVADPTGRPHYLVDGFNPLPELI